MYDKDEMRQESFDCPVCISDTLVCSTCLDWLNLCECKDIEYVECTSCTFDCTIDQLYNCSYDLSKFEEQDEEDWDDDFTKWENSIGKKWTSLPNDPPSDPSKVYECKCDPPKVYACKECDCERASKDAPWGPYKVWVAMKEKCRHYAKPVLFPDGVTVYGSSMHEHSKLAPENLPDFGLYLESMWRPMIRNEFINFPDYQMPRAWEIAAEQIKDAYAKARSGLKVETSCMGGHGRTGTVLACMAIMAGVPREDAVQWVRTNYCNEAVESGEQIWWISWFAAYYNGETLPEPPPPPPKKDWSSPYKAKGPAKQHKKRCKCDECKAFKAIKAQITDFDPSHEIEILSIYNEALAATKSTEAAEKITLQRASGHFPLYDDKFGETYCNDCNLVWPCPNAGDTEIHPGTIDRGYIYTPLKHWSWINTAKYLDENT